jgi:phosphoserine phosphatase
MRFLPVVSSFLRHQAAAPHHLSARLALRCLSTPSSGPVPHLTPAEAQRKLLQADAVCFDVDSTVIQDEGIDVLAEFNGAGQAVKEWTQKCVSFLISSSSFSSCTTTTTNSHLVW